MGDGIFVTSDEKLENMILNENMNNIDGINIYSFSTFDSLKEYTEVNNLEKYSQKNANSKQDLKNNKTYLTKLRSSLSKRKIIEQDIGGVARNSRTRIYSTNEMDLKIKLEKIENQIESPTLLTQTKLTDNISYDYDDNDDDDDDDDDESVLINNSNKKMMMKKSNCGKEHCNYGCICDTISNTDTITRDHCGRYECMFECICNNRKKLRKEIEDSESCSNDDKSLRRSSYARRSKRQKYLSLKAYEHFETDATNKATSAKRSRLEAFNEVNNLFFKSFFFFWLNQFAYFRFHCHQYSRILKSKRIPLLLLLLII
jgi:hypothetical protein